MNLLSTLTLMLCTCACLAQSSPALPATPAQAIILLDKDCPDSIKALIRITPDEQLADLCYPEGGSYRTIYDWLNGDHRQSKLKRYLNRQGVTLTSHQQAVILSVYKKHLSGQKLQLISVCLHYRNIERKWVTEDKARFTTDSLQGVYIPADLEDCFHQIDSFWPDSVKNKVKAWPEKDFGVQLHHGFGMWIRNNWQLWGGSRLSLYFIRKGIYHPDDMSAIILTSYHRHLNGKPIDLDRQIQHFKDYWEKAKQERQKEMQREFAAYHTGDTVRFTYPLGYVSKQQEQWDDDDSCTASGMITAMNDTQLLVRVRLLKSCDARGIIYYDNKGSKQYNITTGLWEKPRKRIIRRMKIKEERWFRYNDWELVHD